VYSKTIKKNIMKNQIKYHKTFGQVEVLNIDATFTTIVITETGEHKKLVNKFANLSDALFVEVKTIKTKKTTRELTKEEIVRAEESAKKQIKEEVYVGSLGFEAREAYKLNKSKFNHC
jgi:hypothetical protein